MASQTLTSAQLLYQVSPIILTGGIAGNQPGQMQSLMALAAPQNPANQQNAEPLIAPQLWGQPSPNTNLLDNSFGVFNVLPGGSLVQQTIPKYPLADMTMAANAIVRDPIQVSLIWDTPMKPMQGVDAWATKLAIMQNLKGMLDQHNNAGGLYIVMTPAYFYINLIMVALTDNSRGGSPLPQNAWRFDFERPQVVTLPDAMGAQSILMRKLTGGLQTPGLWHYPATSGLGGEPNVAPGPNGPTIPAFGVAGLPIPLPSLSS
jgi:hypothetical protein